MIKPLVLTSAALLGACATPLPQVIMRDGNLFDVRYDAAVQTTDQVNAVANAHCTNGAAGYVSQETRFDGFAYRTYRCARR